VQAEPDWLKIMLTEAIIFIIRRDDIFFLRSIVTNKLELIIGH
jgi:hypothetical protein